MRKFIIHDTIKRQYKNNGQYIEQLVRYALTGQVLKADNIAYDRGTDCLNYQIKSARATVCKGVDIIAYINAEKASLFLYVTKSLVAYEMNKAEYVLFCQTFGTVTRESEKNGGEPKIRLKSESKALLQWLTERANK